MNNKLFITILATAFSGVTLATETPNYDIFPNPEARQYCTERNTIPCQALHAFIIAQELAKKEQHNECGAIGLPEKEQQQKFEAFLQALHQEMVQNGIILENAEQNTAQAGQEIAEKLNIADTQE